MGQVHEWQSPAIRINVTRRGVRSMDTSGSEAFAAKLGKLSTRKLRKALVERTRRRSF